MCGIYFHYARREIQKLSGTKHPVLNFPKMLSHGGHNDLKQPHIMSGTQAGTAWALIKLLQMSAFLFLGNHTVPPWPKLWSFGFRLC